MRLVNGLGYSATISSTPFLVDLTPPSPGYLQSTTSDHTEVVECGDLELSGLDCLENSTLENHRLEPTIIYVNTLDIQYVELYTTVILQLEMCMYVM